MSKIDTLARTAVSKSAIIRATVGVSPLRLSHAEEVRASTAARMAYEVRPSAGAATSAQHGADRPDCSTHFLALSAGWVARRVRSTAPQPEVQCHIRVVSTLWGRGPEAG